MEAHAERMNMICAKMLQFFLETLIFTVSFVKEDDGSFTGTVEELDLIENAPSKNGCMILLLEAMKEYARDFYTEFDLWSSAPNRREHIPYVIKILSSSDKKLLEDMRCRAGEI